MQRGLEMGEIVADRDVEAKRVERDTRVVNNDDHDGDDDDNNNINNNNENWKHDLFHVVVSTLHMRDKKLRRRRQ
jgi:hypothetical protein